MGSPAEAGEEVSRLGSLLRRAFQRAPWAFSVLPVLIAWEVVGRLDLFAFLPSLTEVVQAGLVLARRGRLWADGVQTLLSLLQGFSLAGGAGFVAGLLMARSRLAEGFLGLYVDLFQSAPTAALVPVFILLFGLGRASIVATVFFFAFFILTVNVYSGVKQVDPRLVEMARSFGASEWTIVRHVIIPAALPMILAGLRLGVGRAFNGAVLGEMIVSIVGIGGLMMYYGGAFRMDFLFALVFFIFIFSSLATSGLQRLERRLLRWMR